MQLIRNTPQIWVFTLFISIELLLGVLLYFSARNEQAALNRITEQTKGIEAISALTDLTARMGRYRGACTAVLVYPSLKTTDLGQLCESLTRELEGPISRYASLPEVAGSPDQFFANACAINEDLALRIDRLARESGITLQTERYHSVLAELVSEDLPLLIEMMGQIRGALSLYLGGYLSRDRLLELVAQFHWLEQMTARRVDLIKAHSDAAPLWRSLDATESDFNAYFQALEGVEGDMDQTRIHPQLIEQLFAAGTDVIADFQTFERQTRDLLLDHLKIDQKDHYEHLFYLILVFILFQVIILTLFYYLLKSLREAESSKTEAESSSQALKKNLEQRERLFAIVGHELRTPASALKMLVDERLQTESDEMSEEIRSTAQHLIDVIDDMRISTQPSVAHSPNPTRRFSVHQILREAIHATEAFADEHNIEVILEGKRATQNGHLGSTKIIRQLAINLIKNGLVHSQGTKLWVTLDHRPNGQGGTSFVVRVKDNGVGIPEEDRERLFEPFERGKTVSSGTGLGLHVCKELAATLPKGELVFYPNEPTGSVFELKFVLFQAPQIEGAAEALVGRLQGKRILLVEDTATLRMLAAKLLEKQGAQVTSACDGAQALDIVDDLGFDLVITDIMMPNVDGYELVAALRERGFKNPIFGLTGATIGDESARLIEAGADRVMAKPLNIDTLEAELAQLNFN